jgi:hypothetical protein
MRNVILVAALSVLISGCSDPVPPSPSHVTSFGKHEQSLYEQFTTRADLSLSGGVLTVKGKDGVSSWIFNGEAWVMNDGGEMTSVDEHGGVVLRLHLHSSGDLIFSYQASHYFGGNYCMDTGTVVIPKSFVVVR